jgi:putative membrane protein
MNSIDWSKPQRQSRAALLILLYKAILDVIKLLWPIFLLMLFRKRSGEINTYEIIALVISTLSVSRSAFEYYNFRFSLVEGELIIRKGFLVKKNITLPLEKIQAVHIEQTWLHKLLNVSRLSFDSAGSEKLEVQIDALDQQRSAALRELILGSRTARTGLEEDNELPKEELLITLSANDLIKLSLSANHLEAFFILIAFFYSTLESIGVSGNEYSGALQWLYSIVQGDTFKLLMLGIVAFLIVSMAISVIRIVLMYFEFLISRSAKGFRISSGLINKREKFVPFQKIQFISWKANWIRQKIGIFLLQFHASGADHLQSKMQVKVPVTRVEYIPVILESYHPLLPTSDIKPVNVSRAFIWRRLLFVGIIPAIVLLPLFYYYFDANAVFVCVLPLIVWLYAWLYQHKFRLWLSEEALQIRKGIFGRNELVLKWEKIQSVHFSQNRFQLRRKLASVALHTAGGSVRILYIDIMQAREIQNYSLYKIETATEPWS